MKIFLLEKISELCKGCNLWLKIHAFHKMTVVSLIPFRLGYVGKNWQKGMGPNVLACFHFICSSITSKRDFMVLWHKIIQSIKSFMTSSLSRVYYVIKQCWVLFDVEIRVLLNLSLKIRDKNNLSEKKPFL